MAQRCSFWFPFKTNPENGTNSNNHTTGAVQGLSCLTGSCLVLSCHSGFRVGFKGSRNFLVPLPLSQEGVGQKKDPPRSSKKGVSKKGLRSPQNKNGKKKDQSVIKGVLRKASQRGSHQKKQFETYPLKLQALGKLIFYRHIAHVTPKKLKSCVFKR